MNAMILSNDLATSGAVLFLVALVVILLVAWLLSRSAGEVPPSEPIAEYARAQVPPEEEEHHHPEAPAEDDLKRIEGIGPKLEQVLKEAGIRTFAQLAAKTPEELQRILDAAGVARISNPETWPEQAALAAAGDWEGLEALQEQLKGGRRQ